MMKAPQQILLAATLLGAPVLSLQAATFPYFNDFSGTGANTAFPAETTDAEWAISGGSYSDTVTTTSWTPSTSSIPLTGVAGQSFLMEAQFTVTSSGSLNGNASTIGFGFFATSSSFNGTSGDSYYLADLQYGSASTANVGTLRILSIGDSSGFSGTSTVVDDNPGSANLAVELGSTYTLRLTGTQNGSTLDLSLGLFDETGSTQIGSYATGTDTSPLSGANFGFRNRLGIGGGTANINFDNYAVATVPEPAHWAALVSLVMGLVVIRRKRS